MWVYSLEIYPGLYQKRSGQQVEGHDSPHLLCPSEIPPGMLHPAVEALAKENGPVRIQRKAKR